MWLVLAKSLPQGVEELELPAAFVVTPAGLSSRSRCSSLGALSAAAGEVDRAAGAVSSAANGTRGLVAMGLKLGPASEFVAIAAAQASPAASWRQELAAVLGSSTVWALRGLCCLQRYLISLHLCSAASSRSADGCNLELARVCNGPVL